MMQRAQFVPAVIVCMLSFARNYSITDLIKFAADRNGSSHVNGEKYGNLKYSARCA